MKKVFWVFLLGLSAACQSPQPAPSASVIQAPSTSSRKIDQDPATIASEPSLQELRAWKGLYPHEVNFLQHPSLKKRLLNLLGQAVYEWVDMVFEVQTPIVLEEDILYAYAMQAHSGGDPAVHFAIDLAQDCIFVGIRKDGQTELKTEKKLPAPAKLQTWLATE